MAAFALTIAFAEANKQHAIDMLCDRFGLERSEPNAKTALKRLAVLAIREQDLKQAAAEAESKPLVE